MRVPRSRTSGRPARSLSVLPMDLQIGDWFAAEEGQWQIARSPSALRDGRAVEARVRRPGHPECEKAATWPAYEKLAIRRPPFPAAAAHSRRSQRRRSGR